MPRSRRWTTENGVAGFALTKWEPTLAFPKQGAHRATIGDRLFAEVHIDVKIQQEWQQDADVPDIAGTRPPAPLIESVVYDYMGTRDNATLVVRETSRQGERVERSTLFVRLNADGPTRIRFPSGVISVQIDEEQVAIVRWLGA